MIEEFEPDDLWYDYDICYECRECGDNYYYDEEYGLKCVCDNCPLDSFDDDY